MSVKVVIPSGSGSGGAAQYAHTQSSASGTWTIIHNLGFKPNVTIEDDSGAVVDTDLSYPSGNTVVAIFAVATSGKAYLS